MTAELKNLLAPYRKDESDIGTAAIVGNDDAIAVLSAWTSITTRWSRPTREHGKRPADADDRWRWIWLGVDFDIEGLARASQLSEAAAYYQLRSLVQLRLVYPDGSVSAPGLEVLRIFLAAKMKASGSGIRQPAVRQAEHDPKGPVAFECPRCGAKPGFACIRPTGQNYRGGKYHSDRRKAAERASK